MKLRHWIVLLAVCALPLYAVYRNHYRQKSPPPGWTIVTDGIGHYGAKFPDSTLVVYTSNGRLLQSRQQAINRAWSQYEYQQKEADKTPK